MERVKHKPAGELTPTQFTGTGSGPLRREWWILKKWTPQFVTIANGMDNKELRVPIANLTSITIRNINKCDIGGAFERVYIGNVG